MFFINPHNELKNIDIKMKNDIEKIKKMYFIINDEKFSYYHLCKKYILITNKEKLQFILKFDVTKFLLNYKFLLKIYHVTEKSICNQNECINFLCDKNYHYSINNTNLVNIIKTNNIEKLNSIFSTKIQDIKKCINCENLWDFESDIRYIEDNKKYNYSICDNCKFQKYIFDKTLNIIDKCTICLENIYEIDLLKIKCNHNFHKKCLDIWLEQNNNCPLCRLKIDIIII